MKKTKGALLSIIIPVYNTGKVAERIVSRVLNQNFQDFELILVNDGSTDDSLKCLRKFEKQDKRVTVIDQKNSGSPSGARNAGLKRIGGQYLMFLDSDDDIEPDMIEQMIGKITNEKLDLIVCGIKYTTIKNGKQSSAVDIGISPLPAQNADEDFTTYIVRLLGIDGRLYNPCNKIFRTDIVKKHRLQFDCSLNFGEDLTFNLLYFKHISKVEFIGKPLYHYYADIATGTFGKSSLVYENRFKNFDSLLSFANDSQSDKMDDLLGWIKYYWFYSFALAVDGANLTRKEKINLLKNAIALENLVPAKNPKNIGRNKYVIEKVLEFVAKKPGRLLNFVRLSNSIKNSRFSARAWRRLMSIMTGKK
ncbi:glycosyltransferase [Candidatus Saccharibacteria bacterium]|nr:glycosyltransferase [Candidatus Saccharibacteria bacterium]